MSISKSPVVREKLQNILSGEGTSGSPKLASVLRRGALKVLNVGIGQAVPFVARNKFEVLELNKGYIKAKIPLKGNKNHFGGMYAGAIFTVAEVPGGVIAILNFDPKFFPILKDLKVDFIKVAKSDITVTFNIEDEELARIQEDAEKEGKCDFILEGEVVDSEGELVAKTYGTYQLRLKDS